ncbi:ATPase WRNIP1 [Anabrus simplex]|uniref:ATPase WRNIP1 n=1 Tax=Anabrus simplex TaxID=316456 RepID=UPI0035A3644A
MSARQEELVSCPICCKNFAVSEIQQHANKCLFLNSNDEDSVSVKRMGSHSQSPPMKRVKDSAPTTSDFHNEDNKALDYVASMRNNSMPLAEQMRPTDLSDFVGQEHVLGQNMVLRSVLEKSDIPSMILWGPPGCGKTTIAHIIAHKCKSNSRLIRFQKLSATMAGVNDVKEVVKVARNELVSYKRRTILFMDEIHRFNKLQQDIFLPHVESGNIILIGATTENPSFSLNSALLSRCRVIVLEKLQKENLITILERALKQIRAEIISSHHPKVKEENSKSSRLLIDEATVHWLAEMCDGDARVALNSLQLAIQSKVNSCSSERTVITLQDIQDGVKRSHILYDKKGDEHYNIISALHKSIRASDDNAALYWLSRMLAGGEDPIFIARRLVRAASEDIGLADPMALSMAVSAMHGCQLLGMPECDVLLAQCAVYLARAPKSVEVYHALGRAKKMIAEHAGPHPSVPLHLRNAPTRLMKELGYARGYNTAHKDVSNLQYMPEGMEHINFFASS